MNCIRICITNRKQASKQSASAKKHKAQRSISISSTCGLFDLFSFFFLGIVGSVCFILLSLRSVFGTVSGICFFRLSHFPSLQSPLSLHRPLQTSMPTDLKNLGSVLGPLFEIGAGCLASSRFGGGVAVRQGYTGGVGDQGAALRLEWDRIRAPCWICCTAAVDVMGSCIPLDYVLAGPSSAPKRRCGACRAAVLQDDGQTCGMQDPCLLPSGRRTSGPRGDRSGNSTIRDAMHMDYYRKASCSTALSLQRLTYGADGK
ncbi:hypothetical protein IWX48DRAFT_390737 [Phyllosticta citricarpa]